MEEIGKNIFLEDSFAGVVLGMVKLNRGFLIIDSPMRPRDQLAWRERIAQIDNTIDHITLMLDTHIDRTIGLPASGGSILGHENALEIMASRPSTLRHQDIDDGAEVNDIDLPINVRWTLPEMTFSHDVAFYVNEAPVRIIHRPGAHLAGCWVRMDTEKILFVGDSVVAHQPPFLALADVEIWLDELAELQSEPLQDFRIVSSRNGLINRKAVDRLAEFLIHLKNRLPDLAVQEDREAAIADLLTGLLRKVGINKKLIGLYRRRLSYGLSSYLKRYDTLEKEQG